MRLRLLPHLGFLLCIASPVAAVESLFDAGSEGWSLIGDPGDSNGLTWCATSGRPDGHLCESDSSGGIVFGFGASAAFLGDQSGALGGALSWDWIATGDVPDLVADGLHLTGAGLVLSADVGAPSTLGWSPVAVPLVAASFNCASGCAGAAPTATEFAAVLADVTEIFLRGDWVNGTGSQDTTRLDNARLESAPPQASVFVADASAFGGTGAVLGLDLAGAAAPPQLESSFAAGADGWTLEDNAGGTLDHHATEGNPGGFVSSFDTEGGVAFDFVAPAAWLGNRAGMIGGTFSWDWIALGLDNDDGSFGAEALILEGGGLRVEAAVGQPSTAGWTSEAVVLIPQSFSCTSGCAGTRDPPSFTQFRSVMTSLSRIAIRGDWYSGLGAQDTTGVDNPQLAGPPLPRPAWVVAAPSALRDPFGIAVEAGGTLLVSDPNGEAGAGALYRIDPDAGTSALLSSGGYFDTPLGVAVAPGGDVYVADANAGTQGAVIHVDPMSGAQSFVSSGGLFDTPVRIALDAAGDLLVVDRTAEGGTGAVIRVNPGSGQQTLVASAGYFEDPVGIAVEVTGAIVVADANAFERRGGLVRVDPGTGAQSVVSSQGLFVDPVAVAVGTGGVLTVVDPGAASELTGAGAVIRVDPVTGEQALVASGAPLRDPMDVTPVPEPGYGVLLAAGLAGLALVRRRLPLIAVALAALSTPFALRAARGEDFTLVALPDTQFYAESYPATFTAQTQWIVDNEAALGIVYAVHLGDVVNDRNMVELQWQRSRQAMGALDGVVAYGMSPGNHDLHYDRTGLGGLYDEYFPASRFLGRPGYRGGFHENRNSYRLFSAGELDFVVLHLEYDPPDRVLEWADRVLTDHSARRAIVTTHVFVDPAPPAARAAAPHERPDGNSAEQVWLGLLQHHCNVFLVLSGHFTGEATISDLNLCGDPVYQIVQDYQGLANGGDGWLRYFTFAPAENEIRAFTYSPTLDQFQTDADSQFVLPYAMGGGP